MKKVTSKKWGEKGRRCPRKNHTLRFKKRVGERKVDGGSGRGTERRGRMKSSIEKADRYGKSWRNHKMTCLQGDVTIAIFYLMQ